MEQYGPYVISVLFMLGGGVGLLLGFRRMRRYRLIMDTPTSKIRSMAMGIVEIHGHVKADQLITSPFSKTDCVFYKYVIKEYRRHTSGSGKKRRTTYRWETVGTGDQFVPFFAKDDTGVVIVDPKGADFDVARRRVFYQQASALGGFSSILKAIQSLQRFTISDENDFDTSNWELTEITGDSGWSAGPFVGDRRYYEYCILDGDNLFVLGTAANNPDAPDEVLIRLGANEKTFIISDRSEKGVIKLYKRGMIVCFVLGTVFAAGGVALLLYFEGMF